MRTQAVGFVCVCVSLTHTNTHANTLKLRFMGSTPFFFTLIYSESASGTGCRGVSDISSSSAGQAPFDPVSLTGTGTAFAC